MFVVVNIHNIKLTIFTLYNLVELITLHMKASPVFPKLSHHPKTETLYPLSTNSVGNLFLNYGYLLGYLFWCHF